MSFVASRSRKATADEPKHRVTKQIELLSLRCFDLAERVAVGELEFIDAVDLAYSAAVWADLPAAIEASDLIDRNRIGALTGDDVVQEVLAAAFANVRRPV